MALLEVRQPSFQPRPRTTVCRAPRASQAGDGNGRLELSALAYSENGENTLLGNRKACPWPSALQSYKEYNHATKHHRGGDPRTPDPFDDLNVHTRGLHRPGTGEVLWDPPRTRNANQSWSSWTDAKCKRGVLGLVLHRQEVGEAVEGPMSRSMLCQPRPHVRLDISTGAGRRNGEIQ
ncbi:hypothetical protein MKX08_009799 [Trichoderma sp. CBMAI-0020]|nr:hypothetical protein MKX08_009799 [Trichoderma sp. CBMAI-0020]